MNYIYSSVRLLKLLRFQHNLQNEDANLMGSNYDKNEKISVFKKNKKK